jgi:serine protease Do
MASFDPQNFGLDEPPPRPTTPPVRRGFLLILAVLCLAAILVYGIPYVAEEAGYAWETGRSRAATETLQKLGKAGVVAEAGALFRIATTAVSPAVVNIQAIKFRKDDAGAAGLPLGGFGGRFGRGGVESFSVGSGVVIDSARGYVVTNNHVIHEADQVTVRLSQGSERRARVVGTDPKTDLAVLQVPGPLKVAADWGDSDKLASGDWVLAIGSPYMLDHTVTAGIVSATGRTNLPLPGMDENSYQDFIQTDAAINPGNSGGPLVDLAGKVVGINTAILTGSSFLRGDDGMAQSGGFEGIGLAIPSSMARKVVDGLIKNGKVIRGYLGVSIQPVPAGLADELKRPDRRGALVAGVQRGSPADKAGLRPGDVIIALDGKEIADPTALRNRAADSAPGSEVSLAYVRGEKTDTAKLTVGELPADADASLTRYGFGLRDLPPGVDGAQSPILVIDRVAMGSLGARAGLRPGLRVVAVGDTEVHSRVEFDKAAEKYGPAQGLPLTIRTRGGRTETIVVGGPQR